MVGISALDEIQFNTRDQKYLSELLLNSLHRRSTVPYIIGVKRYLAKTIPIISSYFMIDLERNPSVTKSADVLPIWLTNNNY